MDGGIMTGTAADNPTPEQRLRAVDTLLADPEAIPDPLEVELYAYREQITGEGTDCDGNANPCHYRAEELPG
jgi:hypothetical protein